MVTKHFKLKILKFFAKYFEVFLLNSVIFNQIKHISNEIIQISSIEPFRELKIINLFRSLVPLYVEGVKLELIGNGNDGSYVFPKLNGSKLFISGGIGNNLEFEKYFEKENKSNSFILIDGSIKVLPTRINNSKFIKKNILGNQTRTSENIYLNNLIQEVDFSDHDFNILKLDIEGDEYDVMYDLDDQYFEKFDVFVIEFHNFINKFLINEEKVEKVVNKITKYMNPIYISVNNYGNFNRINQFFYPDTFEFTFLNKNIGANSGFNLKIIKDFEFKNNPNGLNFNLYNFFTEFILKK